MGVQHELGERAVKAGDAAAQRRETRARYGGGRLEIEAEGGAEIGVVAGCEVERARRAPACLLDILALVRAVRHVVCGDIGEGEEAVGERRGQFAVAGLQRGETLLERCHLGLQRLSLRRVFLRHCLADGLARLVTAGLSGLHLGRDGARLGIEREDLDGCGRCAAPRQAGVERCGILADQADVVHGASLCRLAAQVSREALFKGGAKISRDQSFLLNRLRAISRAAAPPNSSMTGGAGTS